MRFGASPHEERGSVVRMAALGDVASADFTTFRSDGVLRLPQVLAEPDISELRDHFWYEVEEQFEIRLGERDSWFANPYNPVGTRARRLSGMNPVMDRLRSSGRFQPAEAAIQAQIDALFGSGKWEPLDRWYSLLSFPGTGSNWTIPQQSWHNDEPIVVGDEVPWSIFAFVFLDRVERDTGATLAITGSHRRGELIAAESGVTNGREVRAFDHVNSGLFPDPEAIRLLPVGDLLPTLKETDEWFGDLVAREFEIDGDQVDDKDHERVQRFMEQGTTNEGITSHVLDLSAEAGDVILFDPRCLHSGSANVSDRPRQVLRLDFRRCAP